jgi:uncharacterized protein (DUF885 family)
MVCMMAGCSWIPQTHTEETPPQETETVYDSQEIEAERESFDDFTTACFIRLASSDTLTLHQLLEYPENYGITDPEITFGTYGVSSFSPDRSTSANEGDTTEDGGPADGGIADGGSVEGGDPANSSAVNSDTAIGGTAVGGPTDGGTAEGNTSEDIPVENATDEEILDMLRGFDRSILTDSQQLTYDVFEDTLELSILGDGYRLYNEPLSTISGEHAMLPVILSEYRFQRLEDMYTYLSLLETLPDYITSLLEFEKEKSEAGLFMTDEAADSVIDTCRSFAGNPEGHLLIASFDDRISELHELSDEERQLCSGINARLVREVFIPQYERLAQGIAELKGTGRNTQGLCAFEGGKEYMEYLCRSLTGTDYTPGQIIDLLTDEVNSSSSELYRIISRNPGLILELETFDFGVTRPEEIFEELREKSADEFPAPAAGNYTVSYVPEFLEPYTAQAFYLLPPIDTAIVNRIYINASQTDDPIELFTVMAHEGYPGHMLQQLYFLEKKAPPLRSVFSYLGYLEGWAQYISYKSFEFNETASDDLVRAMQLNELINYDVSALCDLFVNYSGFNQKQLEKYLSDNGFSSAAAGELFTSFVNNPGVYLPYAVGSFEVRSLRAFAEEELGDSFNAYDFHRALLDVGQAPFSVVRREIEKWVDGVKSSLVSAR